MMGTPACFRKYDIIKIVNTALIYLTVPAFYYIVPFTFTKAFKTDARATFRSLEKKYNSCIALVVYLDTCFVLFCFVFFGKEK